MVLLLASSALFLVASLTGINLDISAWSHILWYRSFDLRHFFLRQLLQQRLEYFASLKNTFSELVLFGRSSFIIKTLLCLHMWWKISLSIFKSVKFRAFLFFRGKSVWEFLIPQTIYFCNFIAKGQHISKIYYLQKRINTSWMQGWNMFSPNLLWLTD